MPIQLKKKTKSSIPISVKLTLVSLAFLLGALSLITLYLSTQSAKTAQLANNRVDASAQPSYFVDCTAGNDGNSGTSITSAWKTVDPIRGKVFLPGDVIGFKRGCTWNTGLQYGTVSSNLGLVFDDSGTSTAPITLTAYGTGSAPIFTNTFSDHIWVRGLEITGKWVIVSDLAINNISEYGVIISPTASNVTLRNLTISNVGTGVAIRGNSNSVLNTTIKDLKMIVNSNNGGDDDYGATALVISGSNNEVAHSTILNAIAPSYDYGVDGGAIDFFGFDGFNTISGNKIHHNWVENSDGFFEMGSTNGATLSNNTFYANVLVNNGPLLMIHVGGNWSTTVSGTQFLHNTIYDNRSEWTYPTLRHSYPAIRFSSTPPANVLSAKNNIWMVSGLTQIATHSGFTHEHNLYSLGSGTTLGFSLSLGELLANPLFVNSASKIFTLQPTSPAIDIGQNSGIADDYVGTLIPQGNAPDIGAYEYLATSTTSPSPSPSATPVPSPTLTPSPSPVVIGDTTAPTVQITSPASGTVLGKKQRIVVSSTASDNVKVTKVEVRANGSVKCTFTTSPYDCRWTTPGTAGNTTLEAWAYDAAGNIGKSSVVITVR